MPPELPSLGAKISPTSLAMTVNGSLKVPTALDIPTAHPVRRPSFSSRHSREALFHKDTQNRHLPKQQQAQLEQQQKFQQQLQLQQAHQEFHRQRELHQMRQRHLQHHPFQQPQSHHQQQQQPLSSTSTSLSNLQHHHHHHHYHHYHVHPQSSSTATPPSEAYRRRFESHPRHLTQHRPNIVPVASLALSRSNGFTSSTLSELAASAPSSPDQTSPSSSSTPSASLSLSSAPSSSSSSTSPSSSTSQQHHHHHHHHSLHQQLPQRSYQFSEWTTVKEKERARLLSNVARVRDSQPVIPSTDEAKENLKRLSQRIHQRRTRARETILYDLHQGVKTVEAQVHKQVEMVMSKLKDTPGSKYAFALTHTFLTQLPQAISNTILPSAISAVADTVASRTTNSLTSLRGAAGEDEFYDEEDEDEDDDDEDDDNEEEQDTTDETEGLNYQQRLLLSRIRHDPRLSHQLSSDFDSIALATSSCMTKSLSAPSSSSSFSVQQRPEQEHEHERVGVEVAGKATTTGPVSISSTGASEFLAASTHHNYSSAASQVLNAALPSFIPSMVAPIVCVFSYPTPPVSKPSSPDITLSPIEAYTSSSSTSSSADDSGSDSRGGRCMKSKSKLSHALLSTGISSNSAWTTAEHEGLYLAATRFKLRGQWGKIKQAMNLHRTEVEIEQEYNRLYGHQEGSDDDEEDEENGCEDNGADCESAAHDDDTSKDEDRVFMRFGGRGHGHGHGHSHRSLPLSSDYVPVTRPNTSRGLMDIQSLIHVDPVVVHPIPMSTRSKPVVDTEKDDDDDDDGAGIGHVGGTTDGATLALLNEKPMHILKKEFMVDKRFVLEDIPMHL
ncbi:hypothetical protein BG004_004264 [Podila humilis]|nr:hypothetical protein BG004_004264 [Podila humilis]